MALFVSHWHARVTSQFSAMALVSFLLIALVAQLYGSFFLALAKLKLERAAVLPLQFVCGYFVLSTLLFIASLVSPLGVEQNLFVLGGVALGVAIIRQSRRAPAPHCELRIAPFLCLVISGVGATLWCSDALRLATREGSLTVFSLFFDSFVHARVISEFSHAHGISTLSDLRMAGVQASVYHYASYVVPAAFASITRTGAYEVFAGFLLPFGILVSGLAAFSLAAILWGPGPGIAATIALILLPDAFQQGFGNRYLSYNVLQQIGPASLYGVAYLAVAWVLVLDACRTGRISSVLMGWAAAVLAATYKVQLFVANAFVIMIYPLLFWTWARSRVRLALGILFVTIFFMVVLLSQRFPEVPTLRLDGSGASEYMSVLLGDYDRWILRSLLRVVVESESLPRPVKALIYSVFLVLSTFGAWIIAFAAVIFATRNTTPRFIWAFPIVVLVNYLVMSLGLAADQNNISVRVELLNRPLVWAYFVVVTWTAGAAYAFCFGRGWPENGRTRAALGLMGLVSFIFPMVLSSNLQTFPSRSGFGTFREQSSAPTCLVEAVRYIRANSLPDEVIQDSEADRIFMLTALAERPAFATSYLGGIFREPMILKARLLSLQQFKAMTNEREITEFATRNKISWYVLQPSTAVAWPASFLERTQFSCDGVRVFRFEIGKH